MKCILRHEQQPDCGTNIPSAQNQLCSTDQQRISERGARLEELYGTNIDAGIDQKRRKSLNSPLASAAGQKAPFDVFDKAVGHLYREAEEKRS